MANLGRKGDVYHVRFRLAGKEYKKSLKVRDPAEADAALRTVEQTIHRLLIGLIAIPLGVDPGDFVVSGGTRTAPVEAPPEAPMASDLVAEYLDAHRPRLAPATHKLHAIHLRHWLRHLGADAGRSVERIARRELEHHLAARIEATSGTTAAKERKTLRKLFGWAVGQGYLAMSPAEGLSVIAESAERPPFRTLGEIGAILARGGLSDVESSDVWECLFLAPSEVADLLRSVEERSKARESYLLHAIPAYTGMRRGEVLRLRWADIDLAGGFAFARSRKQSRRTTEVVRRIDLHPELQSILADWRNRRPRGQIVLPAQDDRLLSPDEANRWFWRPMRGTDWCLNSRRNWFKVGFHTYRHSFASNLAGAGVDQRVIDEFMGHTTESMRKRYRHLFPKTRRSAIESFSLARPAG